MENSPTPAQYFLNFRNDLKRKQNSFLSYKRIGKLLDTFLFRKLLFYLVKIQYGGEKMSGKRPKFSWVHIHTQVVLLWPHDVSLNKQQTNCCRTSHPRYKSFMNELSENERKNFFREFLFRGWKDQKNWGIPRKSEFLKRRLNCWWWD